MPISTVQMPINTTAHSRQRTMKQQFERAGKDGFSLMEMIIVLGVLSLLTVVVMVNFGGKFGKSSFKLEAIEIVNTLEMAQNGAAQSNRRYAVEFDFTEQTYTLQEIRTIEELFDMSLDSDERTLSTTKLTDRCRIEYITFDDKDDTRDEGDIEDQLELKSHFVAGRSGWQFGGMIVLTDIDGNPYSIIINRMSRSIMLVEGDEYAYYLEPVENLTF